MEQLSLLAIFGAGLATFASPCILPLIPIYLSVLAGASVSELKAGTRTRAAIWSAVAFSLGLTAVFVALGLATTFVGGALLEHRTLVLQLGGLAVFLFGLKFIGYLQVPWLERDVRPALAKLGNRGGMAGGFVFGAAFALGWTPCIGPILGSVLAFTASSSASPAQGALYLGAYAAGLVLPLLVTAAMAPLALRWQQKLLPQLRRIEVATGVMLAALGILLMTDQLGAITPSFEPAVVSKAVAREAEVVEGPAFASAEPPFADSGATCDSGAAGPGECALPDVGPAAAGPTAAVTGNVGEPRLIEFLSRTCPICRRMEPVLQAAESSCTGHGVSFVRVDVGTPAGRKAADDLRVRGVPTFVLVDAAGTEVSRLVGEVEIGVLKQQLEVLAGETCDAFRVLPPG